MAFTEHMTGLAITQQVYMNVNEITALHARLGKGHWGGTFDILDVYLKEERHLYRGRFFLRYQWTLPAWYSNYSLIDRIQHR
jgi:hypothetical protein